MTNETETNEEQTEQTPSDIAEGMLGAMEDGLGAPHDGEGEEGGVPSEAEDGAEEPSGDEPGTDPAEGDEAAAEGRDEAEAGAEDADDALEVPEGLSEKAQERFKTLADKVKTFSTENEQIKQQHGRLVSAIRDTGAHPQAFNQALEFLRAYNSNNPQDAERALQMLEQERMALYQRLGKDIPGQDPLEGFDDLRQRVDNLDLPQDAAVEIARARRQQQLHQQQTQEQQQHQAATQRQQQAAQAIETGRTQLNSLEQQLKQQDPDYDQVLAVMQPSLAMLARTVHPTNWAQAYQRLYNDTKAALPKSQSPGRQPRPLSGAGTGQGQGTAAPSSMLEAVERALTG